MMVVRREGEREMRVWLFNPKRLVSIDREALLSVIWVTTREKTVSSLSVADWEGGRLRRKVSEAVFPFVIAFRIDVKMEERLTSLDFETFDASPVRYRSSSLAQLVAARRKSL